MLSKNKTRNLFHLSIFLFVEMLLSACGNASNPDESSFIEPPISIQESPISLDLSFDLFEGSKVESSKFSVSDCKSGYRTLPVGGSQLKLYPGDYGCLVKLAEFQQGGETFSPSDFDPFSTWLTGDTAVFQSRADSSKMMPVTITSQASSPLLPGDRVTYKIGGMIGINTEPISMQTAALPKPTLIADYAPQWKLTSIQLFGFNQEVRGIFQFELTCRARMVGKGLNSTCANVPLGELTYILVQDLWNGSPSVYDMTQLFSKGSRKITDQDVTAPSTSKNGGFRTKSPKDKDVLLGPPTLAPGTKMLLILRNAKSGFKIFQLGNRNGTK